MHLAMLIDDERLTHERAMLNRLCLGLIGESVQITWIVPAVDESRQQDTTMSPARQIEAPMRVPPWFRTHRATVLADALDKSPPDVLYALGGDTWPLALDIARRLECPLALDLWKPSLLRALPKGRKARSVACYVAASPPLAADLRRQNIDEDLISICPLGVAPPPPSDSPDTPSHKPLENIEDVLALAIIGSGHNLPAYDALLTGLSRLVREHPQTRIFLELCGPRSHDIWRRAQRLDLLPHISSFSDASQLRPLLTKCDALLMPEATGEIRSLLLEAMMNGLPILATSDPYLDFLIDEETATLIDEPSPERWTRQLRRLTTETDEFRTIARTATEQIAESHRSTRQIHLLRETLERIVSGETYTFKETQESE